MSWTDLIGNSRLNIKKKKKKNFLTHEFDFNQNFFRVVIQSL